jgi:hypothetical protein
MVRSALNQTWKPHRLYRVKLQISGSTTVVDRAASFINRQLHNLKDVDVVDDNAEYVLKVIVLQTRTVGGATAGVAVSSVVLFPLRSFRETLEFTVNPKEGRNPGKNLSDREKQMLEWAETLTKDADEFKDQQLLVGNDDDLKSLCEHIVASFDTQLLEPSRKLWSRPQQ